MISVEFSPDEKVHGEDFSGGRRYSASVVFRERHQGLWLQDWRRWGSHGSDVERQVPGQWWRWRGWRVARKGCWWLAVRDTDVWNRGRWGGASASGGRNRVDNIPGKFNQGNIFFTLPWQHLFLISRKMSSDHYQWAKETKLINIEPKPTTIGGGWMEKPFV